MSGPLSYGVRTFIRDLRSGELSLLLLAVVVAVTALTTVGFFTDRISSAMNAQAGEILAADLRIESVRRLDVASLYQNQATSHGLATARTLAFLSVVNGRSKGQLAWLHGVSDGYPLRGALRISTAPFTPAHVTRELPAPGTLWADSRLLAMLDLGVGDRLLVGTTPFKVSAVLDYRPDQGSAMTDLAPSILLRVDDLTATGLIGPGSRATWSELFAGTPTAVADFKQWINGHRSAGERLVDVAQASQQIASSMDRAQRFLSLAAIATLLLGAAAIAIASRRWALVSMDAVGLLKCLGRTQGFVMTVALTELLLCTVCGSLLGSLFGYAAQLGLVWLMQDLIASILPSPSWRPVWIGSLTALIMVVGYSLPSVILLRNTPPARVLSRNFPAKPASYALSYLAAALALLAILGVLLQDARLVRYTAEFVLLTGAVLWAAGWTLVRLTSQLRGHAGTAWRYGLATLARRQSESVAQIMAFGLGLAVLLLLVVVRADVLDSWRSSLAPNTPNYFLINIQQEQIAALNDVFTLTGVHAPRYAPWVRARLIDINGIAVDKISYPTDRAKAFVEREQNLSWAARLPEDNQILSGHWWENTPAPHHWVSVASEYADELHLKVGDQLGVDVAGERISAQVANVRKVRWDSFRPNFFLLFSPGSLEGVTGSFMTSIHLADSQKPMLATLARNFSSITVFDVDALLTQIRGVINRATLAIEYVSLFTVISGIVVMLSAIQASRAERCFDAAILRTLGASRQLILWGVFSEFVTLGFMAGVIAAAIATLCGYLLAVDLFNVPYHFNIWVWVYGIFGGMVLVGLSGLLATWTVTTAPPSVILRRSA